MAPAERTVHQLDAGGAVRDWLVSPVWESPCPERDLARVVAAEGTPWDAGPRYGRWRLTNGPDVAPVKQELYDVLGHGPHPRRLPAVVEGGPVAWPSPFAGSDTGGARGELRGTWRRRHLPEDGLIDASVFCYTPTYRCFVAGTVIEVDQSEVRRLELRCTGPARLYVGGRLVLDHAEFGYMQPWTRSVEVLLPSGTSEVVAWSWNVALREVRQVLGLAVRGLPVRVVLPSPGADEVADRAAQRLLEAVEVRRWECDAGVARLHGPAGLALEVAVDGGPARRVVVGEQGTVDVGLGASDDRDGGHDRPNSDDSDDSDHGAEEAARGDEDDDVSMLASGEATLTVGVAAGDCPSRRDLVVGHLPHRTRERPEGTPPDWRRELLGHVATRLGSAGALARAALEDEGQEAPLVTLEQVALVLAFLSERRDCADFEAVGLLLLWHRVPQQRWEREARDAVRAALVGMKYWIDQPGLDAMCYFTENHQLVWHTAETLAGEAFPDEVFAGAGWTGREHAGHGRAMARAWIARKLTDGFSEFDSNAYLAIDALALVALVDHAADADLRAAAEALLDKILVTLAANSWRGVHGTAHGRSYTPTLRASCLEETAPIMWWCWGVGALNDAVLPATALATATTYVVPEVVRAIGGAGDIDWAGEQSYRGGYAMERDLLVRSYDSHVVLRKGPGGMVSSVQDYRAGLPGLQEHVWGITLPGQVQVWATHPAASGHNSSTRPNAWVGHRVLPRVRQHGRTVIALHVRGESGAAGTHLWFPAARLDAWEQRGDWLIGRRGAGYVAVACEGGWAPQRGGDEAWQRWLPRGDGAAIVALHRDTRDYPDLAAFGAALPRAQFAAAAPGVLLTGADPDAQSIELTWSGPLLVDGGAADLATDGLPRRAPHLANPAVTVQHGTDDLLVRWGGHRLRLDPRAGRRLEPPSSIAPREP